MEEIYIVIKKQNGKMNDVFTTRSLLEAITSIKQIIAENKMALLQSANAIIIKTYISGL